MSLEVRSWQREFIHNIAKPLVDLQGREISKMQRAKREVGIETISRILILSTKILVESTMSIITRVWIGLVYVAAHIKKSNIDSVKQNKKHLCGGGEIFMIIIRQDQRLS